MRPLFRVASIAYICYTVPGQLSSPKTETSSQPARRPLMLRRHWWNLVCELRSACARTRTFLWMSLCRAGFSTRKDLLGVTSIVRALGLEPACYYREFHDYGDQRYQRLSSISVPHIYNLRKSRVYRERKICYQKTKPVQVNIGERRRPDPQGRPGYLRCIREIWTAPRGCTTSTRWTK